MIAFFKSARSLDALLKAMQLRALDIDVKGHQRAGHAVNGYRARRYVRDDKAFAADMMAQFSWMADRARAAGYASIEQMMQTNAALFEKLSIEWRNRHPVRQVHWSESWMTSDPAR